MNAFEQWLPSSTFLYVLYFSNPYRGFHLEVFSLFKTWIPEAQSESGMHLLFSHDYLLLGFPGGLDGKESAHSARDPGSISGSRRSPGEGNGYPLQYSCPENSMDGGAWQATRGGKESDTTEQRRFTSFLLSLSWCLHWRVSVVLTHQGTPLTSLWPGSPHPSQSPTLFLTYSALDLMKGFLSFLRSHVLSSLHLFYLAPSPLFHAL